MTTAIFRAVVELDIMPILHQRFRFFDLLSLQSCGDFFAQATLCGCDTWCLDCMLRATARL